MHGAAAALVPGVQRRQQVAQFAATHLAKHQPVWARWLEIAGIDSIDARRGPRFSNAVLAVEAALDGQGVALALRPLVDADVASGRLIVPFDLAVASPYSYFLVIPELIAKRQSVAAFSAWLLAEGSKMA